MLGPLATTVFGDQSEAALYDPAQDNYAVLAAVLLAVTLLSQAVHRWLVAQHQLHHAHHGNASEQPR